jgi:hypothetical protein
MTATGHPEPFTALLKDAMPGRHFCHGLGAWSRSVMGHHSALAVPVLSGSRRLCRPPLSDVPASAIENAAGMSPANASASSVKVGDTTRLFQRGRTS